MQERPEGGGRQGGGPEGVDTRLLALRHAAQDATDFTMSDAVIRRFIALRDQGAGEAEIARDLGAEPEVVAALVRADDAQAVAHRIATGQESMYPPPAAQDVVQDTRLGSATVPALALVVVLLGVIVYAILR